MLFPATRDASQARISTELVPGTRPQTLRSPYPATAHGLERQNSTQSSPIASVQNPRVTDIVHGSGQRSSSTALNHRFSLSAHRNQFYASSAPSSSAALRHQHTGARPPVPLFSSNSTGNVHLGEHHQQPPQDISISSMAQGTDSLANARLGRWLNRLLIRDPDANSLFDFPALELDGPLSAEAQLFDSDFSPAPFNGMEESNLFSLAPTSNGTVSPKDLMRDPQASVPPSTAFTNLTSPSQSGSPDGPESFETSPVFNGGNVAATNDLWYPLFPNASAGSDQSPLNPIEELLDPVGFFGSPSTNLRRPSTLDPQTSRVNSTKHSAVSGVGSRKRDKPLPPIKVDEQMDTVAAKRARNTLAARKSRQKKVERFEELEKTIAEKDTEIAELRSQLEYWRSLAPGNNNTG